MFGLFTRREPEPTAHDYPAQIAAIKNENARLELNLADRNNELNRVRAEKALAGKLANEALKERDAARAELAPLKAARERANANLRNRKVA